MKDQFIRVTITGDEGRNLGYAWGIVMNDDVVMVVYFENERVAGECGSIDPESLTSWVGLADGEMSTAKLATTVPTPDAAWAALATYRLTQ